MSSATVRLGVAGRADVARGLRGVVEDSRRAGQEIRRESARTVRDAASAEARQHRDSAARVRDATGRFVRGERAKQEAIRETTREAQRSARTQEEIVRRQERERRRQSAPLAGYGRAALHATMALGAGALAGGYVGLGRVRGFASALGATGPEAQLAASDQLQRRLIVLANQGDLSREQRSALQSQVFATSQRIGADPLELVGGLESAQNRFSDLKFFADNLDLIADAAFASGTPLEDVVGTLGEFRRQMGVTGKDINELIGVMFESARQGSVEVQDIAGSLAPTIGLFSRSTGARGLEGAREFLAVAQTLGAAGVQGSTVATYLENIFAKLGNPEVLKAFEEKTGATIADPVTGERSLTRFLGTLSAANLSEEDLFDIMGQDIQARQAMGHLLTAIREGQASGAGNPLERLAAVDSSAGSSLIRATVEDLQGTSGVEIARQNARAVENMTTNGAEFSRTVIRTNGAISDFASKFPGLTVAAQSAAAALTALAAAAVIRGAAGAGVSAVNALGAAGAATAGAAVAGKASLAAGAAAILPWVLGAASAGAAGYAVGSFANEALGISDALTMTGEGGRLASGDTRSRLRGLPASAPAPAATSGGTPTVRLAPESADAIGRAIVANSAPTPPDAARRGSGGPVER